MEKIFDNSKVISKKTHVRTGASGGVALLLVFLAVLVEVLLVLLFSFNFLESGIVALVLLISVLVLLWVLSLPSIVSVKKVRKHNDINLAKNERIIIKEQVSPEKKYGFIGSNQTKTYHAQKCRFSGLIKPEYAVYADDKDYFKKLKFKKCKVCIK